MAEKARPQCYFDVEINREPVGRIIFQLFSDVCPKTCVNFLCLCTGEKGVGKVTGKKLWYKGSTFHRVVKNFMIQGGDFSEGNGKGGESIFGGYFKDENFVLKHDRAFLLSMANRGKHTNGSQFFITTKAAPHLDGVHVVFGLVISGFEVIEQIENLKTDAASRPYADVRVIDCGLLGSKASKDEKIKQASSESEESDSSSKSSFPSPSSSSIDSSSSESEVEIERNRRRKRKRKTKEKRSKKKRRDDHRGVEEEKPQSPRSAHSEKNGVAEDKELSAKRDKPVVRPEEIPPVPTNRFLLRRDAPISNPETEQKQSPAVPENEQNKGSITKSGRKIRGRGTIRYHTPPRSRSRSESDGDGESSETPPHWKEEMQRLKTYKPPTGEKWSKGDKLNDRLSSRWEEGSLSQKSSSWSHDGYQSDASREHTSRSKARKKDKKIKHKKKSKKVKHAKKHSLPKKDQLTGSNRDESSSRRRKSSQERARRSLSRSSKDSSKKGRSRSVKERRSSAHSSKDSYSNSRSRSYSRESQNSRTASKSTSRSRSRSRTRSQTKSKSRNRNMSGSQSNTLSHSSSKQIKTTSPSPIKKRLPAVGSKQIAVGEPGDSAVKQSIKSADEPVTPFVTTDGVCVSLSDSPPPSRWKPGQKPWKPSYERIQEIKTKASNIVPSQSRYGASNTKGGSHKKHQTSSDSEGSSYSGRNSNYCRKSKNHSSRSRSYSRSYSRSRSRSSSSSHTEGGLSSSYDSSSSSVPNDYIVLMDPSLSKKKTESKAKNKHLRSQHHHNEGELGKTLSSESTGSRSNSISSSPSDEDEITKRLLKTTKALLDNNTNCTNKNIAIDDAVEASKIDQQNSRPQEDCTEAIISDIDKVLKSDKLIETVGKANQEASVSDSQNIDIREDSMSSGKEEGEASSESDSEAMKESKASPSATLSVHASGSVSEKVIKTASSESSTPENNKSKSKKRKHRSSRKSSKKSHSKKTKDQSKKKKEKKQKSQKKKQSFHWQPPLEFGEEEDEETAGGEPDVQIKIGDQKDLLLNKQSTEAKNQSSETLRVDKISTVPIKKEISLTPAAKANVTEPLLNLAKSPLIQVNTAKTSTDIKTFTSHRSMNPMKLKLGKKPTVSTKPGPAIVTSDQVSLPSTNVASVSGDNIQVKDEKTPITQPPLNNATSLERVEAGGSESAAVDNKWKPVQGPTVLQTVKPPETPVTTPADQEKKPQGLRIEIKSKNKVRPGSLFDEVRKTARLNQRPRNQDSSSDERSSSDGEKSQSGSKAKSRSKSRSTSSHKSRSRSYSRSSSRSHSYSSSSSYTRSRSRRRYSRHRSRTRSRSYGSYRSRRYGRSASRKYSRSRSRSVSYDRRRRRSRSRSYTSYDSRSRSRSPAHYRSRSYDRRSSRSRRSSYSGSDRSYGHRRRRSGRS
ncbi:NK-tumor recognition protein isoform X4 [Pseudophryne corroboree]|uniref:NK-tumor recognition protein isoform X4 n=1 Tax=Pseudophryne corroboree TaxID=495146 RepID=UPI0030815E7B